MPILEFDVASGKDGDAQVQQHVAESHLRLEIYNPLSGEVFEAKFPNGRIEIDIDGSITYFSTSSESVNVSLFLGHNLQLSLHKDGRLTIRSPSKIVPIGRKTGHLSKKLESKTEAISDTLSFMLEQKLS
jgi:hypothetical protein